MMCDVFLYPLVTIVVFDVRGDLGAPQYVPHDAETRQCMPLVVVISFVRMVAVNHAACMFDKAKLTSYFFL